MHSQENSAFEEMGIELIENDEMEILDAVEEMYLKLF